MFVLIVGAGRVGLGRGQVGARGRPRSVGARRGPALARAPGRRPERTWEDARGQFTVGTALETDALIQAGIERADVFIASTAGDNTNLIIAQIAQKRFGVEKVIVRVMDPARARLVRRAGPAHDLPDQARDRDVRERARSQSRPSPMYAIIVGAGKVGRNLARELIAKGHEVTLIESSRPATWRSRRSSSTPSSTATRPSCGCSSGPGSSGPTS